ncbi:hypothetical protein F5Y04DRAFT_259681 [Hypomontagnella monticulosa]|nr:hypothetical protein F5Y04DRAFT_259681 [Hypomontagnella monticulosa]
MRHAAIGLRLARVHTSFASHHGPSALIFPISATTHRRLASSRPDAAARPDPAAVKSAVELASSSRPSSPLPASSTLNPPASTRPPPLDLPARETSNSVVSHLLKTGKAYLTFYKTGLRAIFTNRSLLSASSAATPQPSIQSAVTFPTRSDILLRERLRHDLARLPIFGLLLLVCGEFTPLIVLLFPRLTPYTCRIPKQSDALRRKTEMRREASFRGLKYLLPSSEGGVKDSKGDTPAIPPGMGAGHICRTLGLTSPVWDKIGLDGPLAGTRARRAVARIAADDAMIREGGGVKELVDDEVVLACEDRGINVREQSIDSLRAKLEEWLRKTAPRGTSKEEARTEAEEKVRAMLLGLGGSI